MKIAQYVLINFVCFSFYGIFIASDKQEKEVKKVNFNPQEYFKPVSKDDGFVHFSSDKDYMKHKLTTSRHPDWNKTK